MDICIVFAKAPIEGEVKTRLSNSSILSLSEVRSLYEAFLRDTLSAASRSRAGKIFVNYFPAAAGDIMRSLAREYVPPARLVCAPQEGTDFSTRIARSFEMACAMGGSANVMVGSDIPCLGARHLDAAFGHLAGGAGAVLGPSAEGGLYLIGLRAGTHPDFNKIFGEGAELLELAQWLKNANIPYAMLEELTDVDVGHDLVTATALVGAWEGACNAVDLPRNTAAAIKKMRLAVRRAAGTRGKEMIRHA